ncbi:MAG: c-type cytochrome [Pirellulaceae bacterium]
MTYVGKESTKAVDPKNEKFADLRALRHQIEKYHQPAADAAQAVDFVWPYLGHEDRHIRYAARVALEHQPPAAWQERVLAESNPQALITGAVALTRQADPALQGKLLASLDGIAVGKLSETQLLELLRVYELAFIRMGEPNLESAEIVRLRDRLDSLYPAGSDALNRELVQLLVYLRSPSVVSKTIELMKQPSQQQEVDMSELLARNGGYGGSIAKMLANQPDLQKLHYAFVLRNAREGWTAEQRRFYWEWLQESRGRSGGASYQGFINNIEQEAFDNATDSDRLAIEAFGLRKPYVAPELPKPQGPASNLNLQQVLTLTQTHLKGRNFENGKKMYSAARCVLCHRFAGDGGATGPDLTQVAGRFNPKDLSESILDPSKVISDQYRAHTVITDDGKVYNGRIVAENDRQVTVLTDPENSTKVVDVAKDNIDELRPSAVSIMPQDLLKQLNQDEVLDLLAYLLSRGNPQDAMFRK